MREMGLEASRSISTRGILSGEEAISAALGIVGSSGCHVKDLALDGQIYVLLWV